MVVVQMSIVQLSIVQMSGCLPAMITIVYVMFLLQVDAETVAAIDDASLAIHVPLLGDRVALRNHLNVGISGKKPQPAAKRRDLFEKLKARMAENALSQAAKADF